MTGANISNSVQARRFDNDRRAQHRLNGNIGVGGPSANLSVTANAAGDITGYGTLNLNGGAMDMTAGGSIGGAGTEGLGQIFAGSVKLKATTGELIVDSGTDWQASSFDLYAGTNIRGSDPALQSTPPFGLCRGNFTASAGNTGNGRIRASSYGNAIGTLNLTAQGTAAAGRSTSPAMRRQQRFDHGSP
jgi:hypothetical protein